MTSKRFNNRNNSNNIFPPKMLLLRVTAMGVIFTACRSACAAALRTSTRCRRGVVGSSGGKLVGLSRINGVKVTDLTAFPPTENGGSMWVSLSIKLFFQFGRGIGELWGYEDWFEHKKANWLPILLWWVMVPSIDFHVGRGFWSGNVWNIWWNPHNNVLFL